MAANNYTPGAPACFKSYDIRGIVPADIDAPFAFALGAACKEAFGAKSAVIGHDARLSAPMLSDALASGLGSQGMEVFDLGLCGTEEIYYAAANGDFDVGIMITGSHNPADQNGFKFVRAGAIPVSSESGLAELERLMAGKGRNSAKSSQAPKSANFRSRYLRWLLSYAGIDKDARPLHVVANAGNGCAGPVLTALARELPFEFVELNYEPDGNFPNGVPNPLLPERRQQTSRAVLEANADLGVAFDGDFDRCFFFDEKGNFIEGYYLVGLLASALLANRPGEKIIHDPRLYWNTRNMVEAAHGIPVMGKTGHAFMKEKMRAENALYGGEMSAHHYFRDFAFCDSGMLAMLLVLNYLQKTARPLSEVVSERMTAYPCSGEINFRVQDASAAMDAVWNKYAPASVYQDKLDGINLEFPQWRFNLRASNTEPLLRLNVESRGDEKLMRDMTDEISGMLA